MISETLATRIANRLRRHGFAQCTSDDVQAVAKGDSLYDDSALESAILQEFDELGIES